MQDKNQNINIDNIKSKNTFSFDKKYYILYIENINKYLFGFRIKSNEREKTLVLQVPKIYCSPFEFSKEDSKKSNLNFDKIIHQYLNEIKTNRKVFLKEVDAINDYSYSLYLGNLILA